VVARIAVALALPSLLLISNTPPAVGVLPTPQGAILTGGAAIAGLHQRPLPDLACPIGLGVGHLSHRFFFSDSHQRVRSISPRMDVSRTLDFSEEKPLSIDQADERRFIAVSAQSNALYYVSAREAPRLLASLPSHNAVGNQVSVATTAEGGDIFAASSRDTEGWWVRRTASETAISRVGLAGPGTRALTVEEGSGDVYAIAGLIQESLFRISPATNSISTVAALADGAQALAVDPTRHRIFVSEYGGEVTTLDSHGNKQRKWIMGSLAAQGPPFNSLAYDRENRTLYFSSCAGNFVGIIRNF